MHRLFNFIFSINFIYLIIIAVQVAAIIFLSVLLPAYLPFATFYVVGFLINLSAAFLLLSRKSEDEIKIAWLVLILTLPYFGAFFYFLFTHKKRGEFHLQFTPSGSGFERAANKFCGTCLAEYTSATYFSNGADFFDSLFFDLENARKNIHIEFFIFADGKIFRRLIAALQTAKKRGVQILVLADGLGSGFKLKRAKKLLKEVATLKFYSKFSPFPRKLNARTHRKIVTIDGEIAYTGGVNIADEYAKLITPYGDWKDIGVKVCGNAVKVFDGLFLALWKGYYVASAPQIGEKNCLVYCDSPDRHFLKTAYLNKIHSAKRRVHITTPYLSLPKDLIDALVFAAARGVDVKIIIPSIPDKPYAYEITKAFACLLSEKGIKVYTYSLGFVHAKCFISDNCCFIGSSNFDFRSLAYNYECGIFFQDEMTAIAEKDFQLLLENSSHFSDCSTKFRAIKRAVTRLFAPLV